MLRACFSGDFGHKAKVPGSLPLRKVEAVRVERCALRRRRLAPRRAEMDQAEEALALGQPNRVAAGLRAQDTRRAPVRGEAAGVCAE